MGGGIYIAGSLAVTDSTFTANQATGGFGGGFVPMGVTAGGPGADGMGGGLGIAGGTAVITDSTFTANQATGGAGGLDIAGGNGGAGTGGGLDIAGGTVAVTDSTLSANQATGGAGGNTLGGFFGSTGGPGGAGMGGGLDIAGGTVAVTDSTLSANQATGGAGGSGGARGGTGGGGMGGGLDIAGGTVAVTDSTLAANQATGGMGGSPGGSAGSGTGGGIVNASTLTLTGATLSTNAVGDSDVPGGSGGGLVARAGASTMLRNTIVAADSAPSSPDVAGTLTSLGHNLIGNGSGGSGFTATDLVGTAVAPIDPQLEPLGDYGGPTPTLRPLPTSPVVDAGDNTDAPDTDQRGFDRIVNGTIDIGAVELQPDELGGAPRLARHGRAASAVATEVAEVIAALVVGRPQVLPVGESTPPPTGPAAQFTADRNSGSVGHHPLDSFFQSRESSEHPDGNDRPTMVALAGQPGSLRWLIPGVECGEDFTPLLT
jgi:hypothetical protein